MNALHQRWARMGLLSKLLIASGWAVIIALSITTVLSVRLTSQQVHKQLDARFQENISFTARAIEVSLQSGRYEKEKVEEILNAQLLWPCVRAIEFRSTTDAVTTENQASVVQTAPDWFVRLIAIPDRQGTQSVEIGGHVAGEVSLIVSPLPFINASWEYLMHQIFILATGAAIVFFGIWLALRNNLKPFSVLVAGSHALGRGDLSRRMPLAGSSEFRTLFQAFNAMAGDLERLVDELRRRERVYATLVETAPVGVFQADQSGNITFMNKAMQKLADLHGADISTETWSLHVHPDDRSRMMEYARQIMCDGVAANCVYRILGANGQLAWVQVQSAPILDEAGKPSGYTGTVTDITTERNLRAQTEQLSALYATLSQINSAIIYCRNEQALYDTICTIMADKGGFARATVFSPDWDRRKLVRVAEAASEQVKLSRELVELDMDDTESQSLISMTFLSGGTITINDIQNDERFGAHLRGPIKQLGLQSASTIMFTRFGEVVSALSLASKQKDYFSDDILTLIAEVGRDVSFALENFAREAQRKLAEEQLARNEENLRVTLHSIGDAVLATDIDGRVTMMNPVAEALTGWSEAQARGRLVGEVFNIINEETRDIVECPVTIVLREGVIVGLANHTVLIARDGTERPIADSGAPIRYSEDGDIKGVVLVFRDQSEEYRMHKALQDSERLFSSLVRSLPVGVYQVDAEGNTIYFNDAMRKMAGTNKEYVTPQEALAVHHPDDIDLLLREWKKSAATKKEYQVTFRYLHSDGAVVWAQASAVPMFDGKDSIQGYVGAVVDITNEQQHLRNIEQLSKLYMTLSQVNSAIARCTNEHELYDAVARIFVDTGGFEIATLVEIDSLGGEGGGVNLRHYHTNGHIETLVASWPSKEQMPGLAKFALDTGECIFSNDYLNDDRLDSAWRARARDLGVAAATTIPFNCLGKVEVALSLVSSERNFFTADILDLLEEVRRDVSHALESFAHERQRSQAEEALALNEKRLRLSLQVTNIGFYEADLKTERIRFDAICAQLMGLGGEGGELDIAEFSRHAGVLYKEYSKVARKGFGENMDRVVKATTRDFALTLPDGTTRWVRSQGGRSDERDVEGNPIRILGVITDITEARALEERNNLAAAVFDNSGESVLIADTDKTILMVNQAFSRMTGYAPEEILGTSSRMLRSDRHDEGVYEDIAKTALRDGAWQGEIWRTRKNGEVYPAMVTVSVVRDKNGTFTHYVMQETDISAQKEFEQRISHLAYRDSLTGLPNRSLLRDRVEQSIAIAHREGGTMALLFIDLDHFKNINDSLGHAVGDRLLKEIAQRLANAIREMDTVGRLGGDEFLVLLPDADADAAAHVAQKLLEECARPVVIETHSLAVTPSVGIAMYPKDGANFDELLKTADTAMYRAKDEGRNGYRFYTPEMNQAVFQRMVLESSLRRAIENREFVLHYQPKFELLHHTLVGVEALIRWHQPEMGMVSPAQFIPVAEESGLIEAIGKWVLEEACRQIKAWRDEGLPPLRVAVNFSARQFAARNIRELVTETLKKTGLPGDGLEMEITESLLAQDMEYTLEVLLSLKKLGVYVAVDDFGTGYSSLSYLKRFPIDRLKIDQSFVRDLVTDGDDRAIATAVVTLGHSLGIRVIAEGVETAQQMEILRSMGCDEVQGYYLGRPIPADEMTVALRKLAVKP